MDYKKSGVDIVAGRKFVLDIKQTVEATHSDNVVRGIGGFGGLFKSFIVLRMGCCTFGFTK